MLETDGSFMPLQFWFALTILFGSGFVGIIIFFLKRFLDRLDVTIDWLKENVLISRERLDQHDKKHEDHARRHEEHEKNFDLLIDKLSKTTRK